MLTLAGLIINMIMTLRPARISVRAEYGLENGENQAKVNFALFTFRLIFACKPRKRERERERSRCSSRFRLIGRIWGEACELEKSSIMLIYEGFQFRSEFT